MHEVVILSGKGGTGKTSVSAALAVIAKNEAVVADCDVDAANMHLVLKPENKHESVFYSGKLAIVDSDLCIMCGKCVSTCRFDAISELNDQIHINSIDCEGCGYCSRLCPTRAIFMEERRSGIFYQSESRLGQPMVHARLDAGADNSGKLVAKVKSDARKLAEEAKIPYVIVDGAPGIGCPVASSLAGASLVLLVTEPTQSAFHDLKRLITVLQRGRLKMLCLINKLDLNTDIATSMKLFLEDQQIPVVGKLPFDKAVTMAMVNQQSIVEVSDVYRKQFEGIWDQIKTEIIAKEKTN